MDRVGREDLATKMVEKTDAQLLDMFAEPSEWTQEALDAARAELRQRAVPLPPEPAQPVPSQQEQAKLAKALEISRDRKRIIWGIFLMISCGLIRSSDSFIRTIDRALVFVGFCLLVWGLASGLWRRARK